MRRENLQDVIIGAFKDNPPSLLPSLSPMLFYYHIVRFTISFAALPSHRRSDWKAVNTYLPPERYGLKQEPEAVLRVSLWRLVIPLPHGRNGPVELGPTLDCCPQRGYRYWLRYWDSFIVIHFHRFTLVE